MRQRPPLNVTTRSSSKNKRNGHGTFAKRATKPSGLLSQKQLVLLLFLLLATMQLLLNSVLYGDIKQEQALDSNQKHHLRRDNKPRSANQNHGAAQQKGDMNSYDILLKNTIHYYNHSTRDNHTDHFDVAISASLENLQTQIQNLRSQITTLESKSQKYTDDPLFFPFVIRDSRHLTPVQISPDFHVFDYVDLTQARQPKSRHSQLLHNARLVVDDVLEAKRANVTLAKKKQSRNNVSEKYEAPCQKYSIECYAEKIKQVFSYVLREFPSVQYYFYIEADNDLCVPMTMVKDLALREKRYFINTGIGFSGWIMSRDFLRDFLELYGNATQQMQQTSTSNLEASSDTSNATTTTEIRPDVLASYYLTDKSAWTVTRQYWVSHTTLESLGTASLTVKDRRKDETGERLKLDKHLPRCLEPRRGKWKVSRSKKYFDPRDRFGWDYFDYEVCPDQLLFPCEGQEQLKKLVEDDWRVANQTGALAHQKKLEAKRKGKKEQQDAIMKAAAAPNNNSKAKQQQQPGHKDDPPNDAEKENVSQAKMKEVLNNPQHKREWMNKMIENGIWDEK